MTMRIEVGGLRLRARMRRVGVWFVSLFSGLARQGRFRSVSGLCVESSQCCSGCGFV